MAARALATNLAWDLGGGNAYAAIFAVPMTNTMAEIRRLQEMLYEHGIIAEGKGEPRYFGSKAGKSQLDNA